MAAREELRALVLEHLKEVAGTEGETQYNNFFAAATQKLKAQLSLEDEIAILEIVQELLLSGVVVLGKGLQAPGYPWIRVTDFGRECLEEGLFLPYDPDGYLREVKAALPGLDYICLRYLSEAVSAYSRNLLLASSVMLGVSSERLMLLTVEAFAGWLDTESARKRFINATQGKAAYEKYKEFRNRLDSKLELVPDELKKDLEVYLDGIFNFIRIIRNAAGHPIGTEIPRNVVSANIQAFPLYAKRLLQLRDFFRAKSTGAN